MYWSVYLEKFARLCMVLATSVVFRETFSVGSCCVNPNSVGDRIAGHINRRKTHELTSWSQTSWLRWLWQRCRNAENTRFSSLQFTHTKLNGTVENNWIAINRSRVRLLAGCHGTVTLGKLFTTMCHWYLGQYRQAGTDLRAVMPVAGKVSMGLAE